MWSDDERNSTYRSVNDCVVNEKQMTTNYMPVWEVLKQMYDEDKENLYCFQKNNRVNEVEAHKDTESVASWVDYYSWEDYCSEYETLSDDYNSDSESCTTDADESSSSTDEIVDCNNKFIYI